MRVRTLFAETAYSDEIRLPAEWKLKIHMMEAVQIKLSWRSSTITVISVQRHYLHASVFLHSISRRIIGCVVCLVQESVCACADSNTNNNNSQITNAIRNSTFLFISYNLFRIMLPFLVLRYEFLCYSSLLLWRNCQKYIVKVCTQHHTPIETLHNSSIS